MLHRHVISDADWERIKDLLPGRPGQPGWVAEDNRMFIDAVLWILKTGAPWRDLPVRFGNCVSVTLDGRVATGMMASETATSVTLRRANNVQETILRTNIDEIIASGKSLMPEGLEQKVPPQDMADLLGFVLGSR